MDEQSVGRTNELDVVLRQIRKSVQDAADGVRELERGFAALTRSLPWVWTLNQVRLFDAVSADGVVEHAEASQSDLPYRHVVVESDAGAVAVAAALAADGWWSTRELMMAMTAKPTPSARDPRIVELDEPQMLGLMRQWLTEERESISEAGLRDVLAYNALEGRLWGETRYGILDDDGVPVSVTKVRTDGAVSWIEDVYTAPRARRQGNARALVEAAVDTAWSDATELCFIVADDDDWPKDLYAGIGFAPVGTSVAFHRNAEDIAGTAQVT